LVAEDLEKILRKFSLSSKELEGTDLQGGDIHKVVWNFLLHWFSRKVGYRIGKVFHSIKDVVLHRIGGKKGKHMKLPVEVNISKLLMRGTLVIQRTIVGFEKPIKQTTMSQNQLILEPHTDKSKEPTEENGSVTGEGRKVEAQISEGTKGCSFGVEIFEVSEIPKDHVGEKRLVAPNLVLDGNTRSNSKELCLGEELVADMPFKEDCNVMVNPDSKDKHQGSQELLNGMPTDQLENEIARLQLKKQENQRMARSLTVSRRKPLSGISNQMQVEEVNSKRKLWLREEDSEMKGDHNDSIFGESYQDRISEITHSLEPHQEAQSGNQVTRTIYTATAFNSTSIRIGYAWVGLDQECKILKVWVEGREDKMDREKELWSGRYRA
ncbi:hypothetical protein ACH5RR_040525, partial [Cinchona calisaya]